MAVRGAGNYCNFRSRDATAATTVETRVCYYTLSTTAT